MVNMKYCILGVEGWHDQAFIGKLLEAQGLEKFDGNKNNLDPFWEYFIPKYPGKKLYTLLDMPSIFASKTHSVAIYSGEGSNLGRNLKGKVEIHRPYTRDIHAFGLVVDADKDEKKPPDQIARKNENARRLRELFPSLPDEPGVIVSEVPRLGIYVIPDNKNSGTLESILVKCASVTYPEYMQGAKRFINDIDVDRKKKWGPFTAEKALVACIVSILRPGMANTSSIAQDEWICDTTLNCISEVTQLSKFLADLLELPISAPLEP